MKTTYERLCAILVKDYQLEPERVTVDASLEALGIDSLGLADMLFNVEDGFHITLPIEPVTLPTIGDVVTFIDGLIAVQNGHATPSNAEPKSMLLTP